MSLALAAKHLESQGRNQDSKLVHMTPDELKALNKLSLDHNGKPLSTNPKTGLPEAGFLSSILPTVVGFGLNALSGGSLTPLMIAGGVGLATAALSGDIGQGIMAGLGAWSGSGLSEGLAKVGQTAQTAASTLGDQALGFNNSLINPELATNALMDTTGYSKALLSPTGNLGQSISGTTSFNPIDIVQAQTAGQANQIADQVTRNISTVQGPGTSIGNFRNFYAGANAPGTTMQGIKNVFNDPAARSQLWQNNKMDIIGSATPFVTGALGAFADQPTIPGAKEEENPFGLKRLSKDFKGSFPTQPNPYYTAQYPDYRARPYGMNNGGLAGIDRYKSKGKVDVEKQLRSIETMNKGIDLISPSVEGFAPILPRDPGDAMGGPGIMQYEQEYADMTPDQRAYAMMKNIRKRTLKDDLASGLQPMGALGALDFTPAAKRQEMLEAQAKQQIAQEAKSGGLMDGHLGDYSDGGRLLKGPGDGVSDSIPATIGGKQAARLAEGEFVIPARIVSELGNGSTDAGAKRLYAMMDRVKAKRAKAKDIAADTKSYKLLPA
jgi:hypothetical protein